MVRTAEEALMDDDGDVLMPIAAAYLLKATEKRPVLNMAVLCSLLFLTVFSWGHNLKIIVEHIIK